MKLNDLKKIEENVFDNKIENIQRTVLLNLDIKNYLVYTILKNNFEIATLDHDEEKIEWIYYLQYNNNYLALYYYKAWHFSVEIYNEENNEDIALDLGKKIIDLINKNKKKNLSHYNLKRKQSQNFVLFNPFYTYNNDANTLLKDIQKNKSNEKLHLLKSAFFMFITSFEAFLNLIYELYLKKNLRNKRIIDRINRDQIDIKVRLAPTYCSCFNNEIDCNSEIFNKFYYIINKRNDFIHGNFTQSMKISAIIEDNIEFYLEDNEKNKFNFPSNIENLSSDNIFFIKTVFDELYELIISCMHPRYKFEFKKNIYKPYIYVNNIDGELILE